MPEHVLVLDVGKTHIRAITFDADTRVVARQQAAFAALPGPPFRQLPLADILTFAEQAIASAATKFGALSVIPVTHGAAIALVGEDGPVLPILDYEDASPEALQNYDQARPPFAETFSPALPLGLNLGRQLAWLEQLFRNEFAKTRAFLTLPQFIGWHLTGRTVSEATSLGCHSDLWAPLARDFSSLAYARGWRGRFPPVRDAGELIGPLVPHLAKRQGITSEVTVLNGLHDSNASLVPHLSRTDRFTMISSGTWFITMAVGGPVDPGLPAGRDCLANVDVRGRPYPCARFMGGREYAVLAGDAPPPNLADAPRVQDAIARGRMILPGHAGGGGPFPGATGAVPDGGQAADRAAEATLYLAMMTATDLDLIDAAGPIVIEGPASANPLYGAILQALYPDRAVAASADPDATARGAAALALGRPVASDLQPAARIEVAGLADYAARWRAAAEARV